MEFKINQDYHIHSYLSACSADPEQTCENIISTAESLGIKELCITDHFWDSDVDGGSDWYKPQNFEHILKSLPLPEKEGIKMYFGCETDMDKHKRLGISPDKYDKFDFIVVPTTHLHMQGFTVDVPADDIKARSEIYTDRFAALLDADLPFEKVGIAHMTDPFITPGNWEGHLACLDLVSDKVFEELFSKAAKLGMGIEINTPFQKYSESERKRVLRPYAIAKKCGCKFYIGSDAHHINEFEPAYAARAEAVKYLNLTEDDKFRFKK